MDSRPFGSTSTLLSYSPGANSLSVAFKTHLNYVKCMARLTEDVVMNIRVKPHAQLNDQILSKFERLAKITDKSIQGEKDACDRERAYAQVASPWIPVKCYYRLYYLESIFLYLLEGSTLGFAPGGHYGVKQAIVRLLKDGTIALSGSNSVDLGTIVTWETANKYVITSGSNISESYHCNPGCTESIRKKIAEYIELDWKQKQKIVHYYTATAKSKKSSELLPLEFCLLDYFYWMRIKANYRDVDFLDFDNNVNEEDSYEYLCFYIQAANNYMLALNAAIDSLKAMRGM